MNTHPKSSQVRVTGPIMWICTNTLALDRKPRVHAFTLPVCMCSHYLEPKTLTRIGELGRHKAKRIIQKQMIKFQNQIEKPKRAQNHIINHLKTEDCFSKIVFRKLGSCFGDHLRIGEVHVLKSKHKITCVGILERL